MIITLAEINLRRLCSGLRPISATAAEVVEQQSEDVCPAETDPAPPSRESEGSIWRIAAQQQPRPTIQRRRTTTRTLAVNSASVRCPTKGLQPMITEKLEMIDHEYPCRRRMVAVGGGTQLNPIGMLL